MEEQIVAWLREHAEKCSLKQRGEEMCRRYLQSKSIGKVHPLAVERMRLHGRTILDLDIRCTGHSLLFESKARDEPRVFTYFLVGVAVGEEPMAIEPLCNFEYETRLDGGFGDYWFNWHWPELGAFEAE